MQKKLSVRGQKESVLKRTSDVPMSHYDGIFYLLFVYESVCLRVSNAVDFPKR